MEVIRPAVAGLDVHKKQVTVTVLTPGPSPIEPVVRIKRFGTFWRQLQQLAAWLVSLEVRDAAMEATGVYWWPVYHALAATGAIEVCVTNAAHMRNLPDRKTDIRDSQWIAELHRYGWLRPSFIPPQAVAELRARTRYRKTLIAARTAEGQRLAKTLEDAGIKIDSVASRLLGVSGRAMIEALIAGERDPQTLAGLARGLLRHKLEELRAACDGQFSAAHAQMCRLHLAAHDRLSEQITELNALVAQASEPFTAPLARLQTIPGIGRRTAEVIIAETGGNMARFPTPGQLAAWAGLAPGNHESAGKRRRTGTRRGNPHLQAALVEAAWATARTRTRPGARFRRLSHRFGRGNEKRAAIAIAHTLLRIIWTVLAHQQDYREDGADFYDQRAHRNRDQLAAGHLQALQQLGYRVTLQPEQAPANQPPPEQPAA
jgi:transposase